MNSVKSVNLAGLPPHPGIDEFREFREFCELSWFTSHPGIDALCFFLLVLGFYRHYRGTLDKRISEGLFCPLFFLLVLDFYRHYRGDP